MKSDAQSSVFAFTVSISRSLKAFANINAV